MSFIKKKMKKSFALLMALIMMLSCSTISVNAASDVTPRLGSGQLEYGVSRVNYYITDSILNHSMGSTLVTLIDNAANSWVYTGYGYNPLYMYRTYDLYSSNLDIFGSTQIIESYNRVNMSYWRGTSANPTWVDPTTTNWEYAEMTLFVDMHSGDQTKLQRSIAHGIGHALGLDDNYNNPDSVMCDFYHVCNVYKPGKADHDGLNAIYN